MLGSKKAPKHLSMSGSHPFFQAVGSIPHLVQCLAQLVRAGSGTSSAANSFQTGNHRIYWHAFHQT